MLRQRKKPTQQAAEIVRNLDTFPKSKNTPEEHFDKSGIGGIVSIFAFVTVHWILFSEIRAYFFESHLSFKFSPDTNYNEKLSLNIDITVAMPCHSIGADAVDWTEQSTLKFGKLEEQDTWFRLTPEQEKSFEDTRLVNTYLREEFHAIHELLWKSGQSFLYTGLPKREMNSYEPTDACRIFGTLYLNKVAGNFHITAGKAFQLPDESNHIHISAFTPRTSYNFSHRILQFSFGESSTGIIHPLTGDEKVTDQNSILYQYFIEVVPTDVETFLSRVSTYQYSVKENERIIDHDKGSHGVPGIFFKYDMSSLRVRVKQERQQPLQFFISLFSTIAGLTVFFGVVRDCLHNFAKFFTKGKYIPIQTL